MVKPQKAKFSTSKKVVPQVFPWVESSVQMLDLMVPDAITLLYWKVCARHALEALIFAMRAYDRGLLSLAWVRSRQ